MNYGFAPSIMDGTEHVFKTEEQSTLELPDTYDYRPYMPSVIDQGQRPICVPCSISGIIAWKYGLNGAKFDFSLDWIYSHRDDKNGQGMTFKTALSTMRHIGYVTNKDYKSSGDFNEIGEKGIKIDSYARLMDLDSMKKSLFINGPFVLALPVHDSSRQDFWNGNGNEGAHAICAVGYNPESIIIRNSWGTDWGDKGYTYLNYADFHKIYEAWAIIGA